MAIENTNDYIVGRLANFTNTAEGSLLPPPQKGQFRVPFVSGLQVLNSQGAYKQTTFILAWSDIISIVPTSQALTVDHYNIYYVIPGDGTGQPVGPFSAKQSPAVLTVPFPSQTPVTFTVQTVLTNGMTSELASSPTATGVTAPTSVPTTDITTFRALAYQGVSTQAFNQNTTIALSFDTNVYNIGNVHSTSVNPTRFVAPATGVYMAIAGFGTASNLAGKMILSININGNIVIPPAQCSQNQVSGSQLQIALNTFLPMNVNDYLEFEAFQSFANTTTLLNSTYGGLCLIHS